MRVFSGKEYVKDYIEGLKERAARIKQSIGREPELSIVLVGNDPSSLSYIRKNADVCKRAGVNVRLIELDEATTTSEIRSCINRLNSENDVDGILVQMPLPAHVRSNEVVQAIAPDKDVDGVTEHSAAMLYLGAGDPFLPNTPMGVMSIIKSEGIETKGKRAVVLGRSNIVGKPMAMMLMKADATVTICHSKTENIREVCKEADILVCAIGKAHFVSEDMVKEGTAVFDIGTNYVNGKLTGDVDFEKVAPKTSFITPVPNGCGPVTVCMLIENTLRAAEKKV
jgi:methylenetetrahydrofolate dehydrogenase (NADP+)/methenyltetrahydrofolate cyclohydrolase